MALFTYILGLEDGTQLGVVASNIVAAHRAARENGHTPLPGYINRGPRMAR